MYTERENTPNENGGFTMNEKTARQIAEMKNQTEVLTLLTRRIYG